MVLKVGNLYLIRINIRVSIVGYFKSHLRLSMEASVVLVIILARVVVSLQGVCLLGILDIVVNLGQFNLLV